MPPKEERQKLDDHHAEVVQLFAGERPPGTPHRSRSSEPRPKKSKRDDKGTWKQKKEKKDKTKNESNGEEEAKAPPKKAAPKPAGKRVVQDDSDDSELDLDADALFKKKPADDGFRQRKRARPAAMRRHGITLPAVKAILPKDSLRTMTGRRSFHIPVRPFSSYLSMPRSQA